MKTMELYQSPNFDKNEELSIMAESVYMSIATYCGIKSNDKNLFTQTSSNKKVLIEGHNIIPDAIYPDIIIKLYSMFFI